MFQCRKLYYDYLRSEHEPGDTLVQKLLKVGTSYAELKVLSVSSAIDYTRLSTIVNLLGVIKLISRSTHQDSKQNRMNHACIHSNALIARMTIKLTRMYVHSENTDSIENGIPKNIKNFGKPESN